MDVDNVAIRLKGFIDEMGLTNSQFADQCSIPRPSLSQILTGRNKKISDVIVGQIHSAFPDLSVLWLLFGEGDMLLSASKSKNADNNSGDQGSKPAGSLFDTVDDRNQSGRETSSVTFRPRQDSNKERDAKVEELKLELEKLRNKPRKVSQITVYYDDSTFETFYPAAKSNR